MPCSFFFEIGDQEHQGFRREVLAACDLLARVVFLPRFAKQHPMNDIATPGVIDPTGGEAWWFLGTLAIIRIDGAQTARRFAIMEFLLPKDASPPMHAHPQDETFMLLDGQMTIWIAGQPRSCTPGSIAFAPGGVGHSFIVESDSARVLTLSTPSGIEDMVRGLGQRALERRIPDDDEAPYPPKERIEAVFSACGIKQLGLPPR